MSDNSKRGKKASDNPDNPSTQTVKRKKKRTRSASDQPADNQPDENNPGPSSRFQEYAIPPEHLPDSQEYTEREIRLRKRQQKVKQSNSNSLKEHTSAYTSDSETSTTETTSEATSDSTSSAEISDNEEAHTTQVILDASLNAPNETGTATVANLSNNSTPSRQNNQPGPSQPQNNSTPLSYFNQFVNRVFKNSPENPNSSTNQYLSAEDQHTPRNTTLNQPPGLDTIIRNTNREADEIREFVNSANNEIDHQRFDIPTTREGEPDLPANYSQVNTPNQVLNRGHSQAHTPAASAWRQVALSRNITPQISTRQPAALLPASQSIHNQLDSFLAARTERRRLHNRNSDSSTDSELSDSNPANRPPPIQIEGINPILPQDTSTPIAQRQLGQIRPRYPLELDTSVAIDQSYHRQQSEEENIFENSQQQDQPVSDNEQNNREILQDNNHEENQAEDIDNIELEINPVDIEEDLLSTPDISGGDSSSSTTTESSAESAQQNQPPVLSRRDRYIQGFFNLFHRFPNQRNQAIPIRPVPVQNLIVNPNRDNQRQEQVPVIPPRPNPVIQIVNPNPIIPFAVHAQAYPIPQPIQRQPVYVAPVPRPALIIPVVPHHREPIPNNPQNIWDQPDFFLGQARLFHEPRPRPQPFWEDGNINLRIALDIFEQEPYQLPELEPRANMATTTGDCMPKYEDKLTNAKVRLHIRQFNLWATLRRLAEQSKKYMFPLSFKTTEAKHWFDLNQDIIEDVNMDFDDLVNRFLEDAPIHDENALKMHDLLNVMPKENEMASDYIFNIRVQAGRAWDTISEELIVDSLIDNLPDKVTSFINARGRPDTYNGLRRLCKDFEQKNDSRPSSIREQTRKIKQEAGIRGISLKPAQDMDDSTQMFKILLEEMNSKFDELKSKTKTDDAALIRVMQPQSNAPAQPENNQQGQARQAQAQDGTRQQTPYFRQYRGPPNGNFQQQNFNCRYCGIPGHFARECRKKQRDLAGMQGQPRAYGRGYNNYNNYNNQRQNWGPPRYEQRQYNGPPQGQRQYNGPPREQRQNWGEPRYDQNNQRQGWVPPQQGPAVQYNQNGSGNG